MEAQGVTTLSEALRNVPGISLQAGEGGGASNTSGDMFNLRGFSANNSLFVDGVRDDGLISRDVFNLEQVEVFLGPTGTDVGRGTAAGYVNMTTKTPRRPDALRRRRDVRHRRSAPRAASTSTRRAVRRRRLVAGAAPRSASTRWSRTAASPAATRCGCGRRPSRRRSRSASARTSRVAVGGQFLHQDNLPDYGIPGAAWPDGPLVPGGRVAAEPGRPGELLRHARRRLRRGRAGQRLRQGRARPPADGAAADPAPLQPGPPRRGDLHASRTRRPTTRPPSSSRSRARATSARTRSPRTRPACRPSPAPDGRRTRSSARLEFTQRDRSSRRRSAASARARPPHLRARRQRPGDGHGRRADRRVQRRHGSTAAVSVFDTVRRGPAPAAHRRHARRALRRRRSWPVTRPASRPPTSTRDDTLRQRQGRRALQAHRPGQRLRLVRARRRRRPARRTSR